MKLKKTILKNGLRIVTVTMDAPTTTALVMVEAGSRYETPEINGLSHFLEHMCFKGTNRRSAKQIAHELEGMGADTNAFTSYDYTGYYAKGRAALLPRLLDVVADVYLNSVFPVEEIEKERGVICGEIDMYNDLPQQQVMRNITESIYGEQPAGYSVLGPKENIKRFTREDFIKYRTKHYHAATTTVIVTGPASHSDVVSLVKKMFKDIPVGEIHKKKKITKTIGKKIFIEEKKTDQSHVVIGGRAMSMSHKDSTAFDVAVGVLGKGMSSRLFMRLREEMGAGYYVSAGAPMSDDAGIFMIRTGTEPKRVPEVIEAIIEEIKKLQTTLVSDEELRKTKEYLIGGLYMDLESTDSVAMHVGYEEILHQKIKMQKEIEKEIRAITSADIRRVMKSYFKPEYLHLAIIGPGHDTTSLGALLVK